MACDICLRDVHTKDLAFLCPIDARNQLYAPRLALAHLLLESETLKSQVTDIFPSPHEQTVAAENETSRIFSAAEKLRSEIEAARAEIRERRASLERKKEKLGEAREKVEGERRRQKVRDEVERKTSVRRLQWAQAAEEMARHRAFLCNEAARLYGVKKGKGSGGKYVYQLARLPVVELTNMNALTPEVISTSLAHICHILVIASHYLAIRLPAEIVLPHRDHPRPAIFNLASSWQPRPTGKSRGNPSTSTRSPSTLSLSGAGNSPTHAGGGDVSRPRPLYVDKPLAQLAKDDTVGYAFFLEGVTLLAYNVAWLCCTQGVSVGEKSNFEDVCQMGRNLYNLLIARQSLPTPAPAATTADEGTGSHKQQNQQGGEKTSALGRYSHGSTYYSLLSAEGSELVRNFKLPSPMKLVDKLRRKLMGDAPDWEVLDDDAWRVDGEEGNAQQQHNGNGLSKASPKPEYQGWMRVKSR